MHIQHTQLETFAELEVTKDVLYRLVANPPVLKKGESSTLHYACQCGTLHTVQELVHEQHVPFDARNSKKNSPLHVACARGSADIALFLIDMGADVKAKDKNGWSPIHYACYGGSVQIVQELIRRGAKIKALSKSGWTPLHCASVRGHVSVAQILYTTKEGEKLTKAEDIVKNTALHYACMNGHLNMVEFLLAKGAKVNGTNSLKQTPLHLGCAYINKELISLLLLRGANINAKDERHKTPIHYASERGQADIVELLLLNNADVNAVDKDSWSPLHFAFIGGHASLCALLLNKGAFFCAKDTKGISPLALTVTNRMDVFHKELFFGNQPIEPNCEQEALGRLQQLVKMNKAADFSNVGLHGFPPGLAYPSFLHSLDLSSNPITIFPADMSSFVHLRKLSFAHNSLRAFPAPLITLPALTSLDLSDNLLTDLPPIILQMTSLTELDLSNNRFMMLPSFLSSAPKMRLELEGNPLTCIPIQIKSKGYKEILVYLKQLQEGYAAWGRMKVMLVGQEGVGKTSLLSALQKKAKSDVTQILATDGIEVSSFVSKKVQFRAWDFGGQLVFYPTHQFFLTRGCVYLIMFDLSKLSTIDRVDYWLQQLKPFVFDDPKAISAIIIGTHADKEGAASIDVAKKRFSTQQYPFIKAFLQVSCKNKGHFSLKQPEPGLASVVEKLVELSKEDKTFCSVVPESYLRLESKLMDLVSTGVDYIEYAHYLQIVQSCQIAKEDLHTVTRFMHDAGVLLHFQGIKAKSVFWGTGTLKNKLTGGVVILNPQWLANVMATIITFSHKWVRNGILMHSDLAQLWKEKYHPDVWNLLLGILEGFEVLYPLQSDHNESYVRKYLVPSLLPSIASEIPTPSAITQFKDLWLCNPAHNLRRVYSWDVLPMGFFPRFTARVAHLRAWDTQAWWVDAVLIAHGPFRVFVRFIEGRNLGEHKVAPSRFGNFHLEIRVTRTNDTHDQTKLAPMLTQLSHLICALRDTAYHRFCNYSIIHCSLCLSRREKIAYAFTYKECMDNMLHNIELYCPTCKSNVSLEHLAPDIAFVNVPQINEGLIIEEVIGQGGFGKVYKGTLTDAAGTREVAVKETVGRESDEYDFQMLQHEVFLMSAIKHPNLVLFYGIAQQPTLRIVMEFVPGTDLGKVLYANTLNHYEPPVEWQLRVMYDIACAMQYLHNLQPPITHRDLRSPNVLILGDDDDDEAPVVAKVIDLGLAQQLAPNTYGALETWQWMAPETILSTSKSSYNEKCDVYSFAIVAWEIIAQGKMPFAELAHEQIMSLKERIVKEALRPIIPEDCPEDIAKLIMDCWQNDSNARPAFNQIICTLEKLLTSRNVNLVARYSHAAKFAELTGTAKPTITSSDSIRLGASREVRSTPSKYRLSQNAYRIADSPKSISSPALLSLVHPPLPHSHSHAHLHSHPHPLPQLPSM